MSVVMAQIQFSLIRIKIGRPERLLTPTSLRAITSHFCFITPAPSMWMSCITPKRFLLNYVMFMLNSNKPIKVTH